MRSSGSARYMGLPWLLAESLRALLFNLQATLNARVNLISLIYSITAAILEADGTAMAEPHRNRMEAARANIEALRESYQPIMDSPESYEATSDKRTDYEQLIDITVLELMFIIHKYELVDASMIGEKDVRMWSDMK